MLKVVQRIKVVKDLILSHLDQLIRSSELINSKLNKLAHSSESRLDKEQKLLSASTHIIELLEQQDSLLRKLQDTSGSSTLSDVKALNQNAGKHPIFLEYPIEPKPRYGYGLPGHPQLSQIIDRYRETYQHYLRAFLEYQSSFAQISKDEGTHSEEPYWSNIWLPPLDAIALYGFLSQKNPKRYFEIGSGNSTKFARRAIRDHGLQTKITSFDPFPRAEIDGICDRVVRQKVEDVDLDVFDELEPGDILFVDNSHCVFTNSDATVVFLDILPRLKPGVLVEFHDIFLPYDYPPAWVERYYSEQYMLAAYILAEGHKFDIVFPVHFISLDAELSAILDPIFTASVMSGVKVQGGSFWIETK